MAEKKRKNNFSHGEILTLLEAIAEDKKTLLCSFTSTVTNKKKNELWSSIAQKVSLCSDTFRTIAEVKEKWSGLKKKFKERQTQKRQTGNGAVATSPYDSLVEEIMGKDSDATAGIKGQNQSDIYEHNNHVILIHRPDNRVDITGQDQQETEEAMHVIVDNITGQIQQGTEEAVHVIVDDRHGQIQQGAGEAVYVIGNNDDINLNASSIHSVDTSLCQGQGQDSPAEGTQQPAQSVLGVDAAGLGGLRTSSSETAVLNLAQVAEKNKKLGSKGRKRPNDEGDCPLSKYLKVLTQKETNEMQKEANESQNKVLELKQKKLELEVKVLEQQIKKFERETAIQERLAMLQEQKIERETAVQERLAKLQEQKLERETAVQERLAMLQEQKLELEIQRLQQESLSKKQ